MQFLSRASLMCALLSLPACGSSQPPAAPPSESGSAVAPSSIAADPEPAPAEPAPTDEPADELADPQAAPTAGAETRTLEVVADFIKARRDRIRTCYDRVQRRQPSLKGDLAIRFVLSPAGDVQSAEYAEDQSTIHSKEMADCAIAEMKTWKFPASSKGMESKVTYPFNFNPRR